MAVSRRKFLQISSVTGAGLLGGLPGLTQLFQGIPPEEQNFIPITGIFPNPTSIKERGIHLRWALPPSKGIPDQITIFRRRGSEKAETILLRPADSGSRYLPATFRDLSFKDFFENYKLSQTNYGSCYENSSISNNRTLRITFIKPVDYCNIQLGDVGELTAKAYFQDNSVAASVQVTGFKNYASISLSSNSERKIKYVEIPANFKYLYFIEYYQQDLVCTEKGWEKIDEIDNILALKKGDINSRISPEVVNYYCPNGSSRDKYVRLAPQLLAILGVIKNPSIQYFSVPDGFQNINQVPPDQLNFKTTNNANTVVNAWNLLMLESIDPNVARMLGLYYVDKKVETQEEIYDYKIEASYSFNLKRETLCGVVQSVGGRYTTQPMLQPSLSGLQINKTWWEFDDSLLNKSHLGNVKLTWPQPVKNTNKQTWERFIEPVVFALKINRSKEELIVPQVDDNGSQYFIDFRADILPGSANYEIFGIDIFGQVSNSLNTTTIFVSKDAVPPPIKLSFLNIGSSIRLKFEYGGSQYLVAPDIREFNLYQKNDSLFSENNEIKYIRTDKWGHNALGHGRYQVTLPGNPSLTIYKTVHFVKDKNLNTLPASQRKKFKIESVSNNLLYFTSANDFVPPNEGYVLLAIDATDKSRGWSKVLGATIRFQDPSVTKLRDYTHFIDASSDPSKFATNAVVDSKSFHCKVVKATTKKRSNEANLFGSQITQPDDYTEIVIDRAINESDIFSGGLAKFEASTYQITAQSSAIPGASNSANASIILNGVVSLNTGDSLQLYLPINTHAGSNRLIWDWMVFQLDSSSSLGGRSDGELLLRGTKNSSVTGQNLSEKVLLTAQVYSDFYPVGNKLEVLARIDKAVSFLNIDGNVLYFQPYVVDITNAINSLTLTNADAHKSTYFSVETVGNSNTVNSSPLSLVSQFIKTRNASDKPVAPAAPFASIGSTAADVYLKIPNKEGRSTFLLEWVAAPDLRYEVGRALDKTIISVHSDLWLKGLVENPAGTSLTINGNALSIVDNNAVTGLIQVQSNVNIGNGNINDLVGGRLIQGAGNAKKGFEIVTITNSSNQLTIMIRPMVKGITPDNAAYKIEKLPDYKQIHDNSGSLKAIVDLCPSAFNVVTGQPLRNTNKFLDQAPGVGNSRFYYKIRAVDASENRSDWSPSSVPIWQLNTSSPDAPKLLPPIIGDRSVTLVWEPQFNADIIGYRLYRKESQQIDSNVYINGSTISVQLGQVTPLPLVVIAETLRVPKTTTFIYFSTQTDEQIKADLIGKIIVEDLQSASLTNLFASNTKDVNFTKVIKKGQIEVSIDTIKGLTNVPDGTFVRLKVGNQIFNNDPSFQAYTIAPVEGNKKYIFQITAQKFVKGINTSIESRLSEEVKLTGIDRSIPNSPVITSINWIKDGTLVQNFVEKSKAQFIIDVQSAPQKVRVMKRKIGTDKWINCAFNGEFGWVNWTGNNTTITITEDAEYSTAGFEYKAAVNGKNNINSNFSQIISK
jgi:hypothetical protein